MARRLVLAAFLLWELWWVYEYATAPRPDVTMQSVGALLFGGGSLVIAALLIGAYFSIRAFFRLQDRSGL